MNPLLEELQLPPKLAEAAQTTQESIGESLARIEAMRDYHQGRIIRAFREAKVSEYHLLGTTGYGYHDTGRDALDQILASLFGAEKALVRQQFVSGTHAIAACLYGVLRPGDEVISVTGRPYDTLEEVIGIRGQAPGSLKDFGVTYGQVDLLETGEPDFAAIASRIGPKTRMALIQRSRGYAWRPSLNLETIGRIIETIRRANPAIVIFVDNCYGELVEKLEPSHLGADLIAGSLIKNLGGGLAPTGGYIAGREEYVEAAANRLTAPGIGGKVGPTLGLNRPFYQGLFLAPQMVAEALKGAVFGAHLLESLGFDVSPAWDEKRTDLIQAFRFHRPEAMIAFCQGIQKGCPIDSYVEPEPWEMPGYSDPVIMAGGTFIQGATSELSADGPIREPYIAYMQGGLGATYVQIGILEGLRTMWQRGILS